MPTVLYGFPQSKTYRKDRFYRCYSFKIEGIKNA